MSLDDYTIIGPLAYRGKKGCENPVCTQLCLGQDENGRPVFGESCYGWHCSYCDEPCSSQGHGCDAANAILGEAERIAKGESDDRPPIRRVL